MSAILSRLAKAEAAVGPSVRERRRLLAARFAGREYDGVRDAITRALLLSPAASYSFATGERLYLVSWQTVREYVLHPDTAALDTGPQPEPPQPGPGPLPDTPQVRAALAQDRVIAELAAARLLNAAEREMRRDVAGAGRDARPVA